MNSNSSAASPRTLCPVRPFVALTLACLTACAVAHAQTADIKTADIKAADAKPDTETYQTIYLTNLTQQNEFNDVLTDLRNMLPKMRMFGISSQNAISLRATPEDMQIAQKIISDLDHGKRLYRLTYTINESDSGKHTGAQSFSMIVASGGKTTFKQGARVPIVTGVSGDPASGTQVQYMDVGLNIEASADGFMDGLRLRSKVEQTNVADEKSGVGIQDPILRQTVLDDTSTLTPGKPLTLGSLDVPGTTRKQEIEVIADLVK